MYIPKTEGNFFSWGKSMVKGDFYSVIHLAQDRTEQKNLEMLEILDFFNLSIDSLKRYQSIKY